MKKFAQYLLAASLGLGGTTAFADALTDAVKGEHRSADAKVRDEYRNPQQTLRFFGIQPDMTVVEIWPGGGWYADILAPMLKEKGNYVAAHFFIDEESHDYYRKSLDGFKDKMEKADHYSDVTLTAFHPGKAHDIAEPGSADAVLTFRNVHNWYMNGGKEDTDKAFESFFKALKPGGILGVVEHEMPESGNDAAMKDSGYMKRSVVMDAAKKAGFKLAESSDVNANPQDNADHPRGVWTLPPRLALDEKDREKYLTIGESNRMTLKFVKPKS
ncbi:class I SAM-dependent methyltransferase [Alteromonas halophila]|uniref:Methyltransferase n=1 Tax=Alteromonas halophila TaxID=516698 RepID=A0A918JN00_9ALTE|nr:class I SAM-dependent methyltransferase [Alteromonas halophila]GGW90645.1 methyltransferase [Alteromonas halophila]